MRVLQMIQCGSPVAEAGVTQRDVVRRDMAVASAGRQFVQNGGRARDIASVRTGEAQLGAPHRKPARQLRRDLQFTERRLDSAAEEARAPELPMRGRGVGFEVVVMIPGNSWRANSAQPTS